MSSKQLARTVIDGRALTLTFAGGNPKPLVGYLCGMDDFHLFIITADSNKHLVHKGSVAMITLDTAPRYQGESNYEEMETVIGPFRAALQKEHLAPTTAAKRERQSA